VPTIGEIRAGLRTRLRTISGWTVYERVPDTVDPDCAVIRYAGTGFDSTMSRGSDEQTYIVQVMTSKASDRGQDALYPYLDGEGDRSIKVAIEADHTLGGLVDHATVTEVREPSVASPGGVDMYSAELVVTVGIVPSGPQ
jgi:hypothetical protein